MQSLILDTSTNGGILAVSSNGLVLDNFLLPGGKELMTTLFPALKTLLTKYTFDNICLGVGPGSYMGLRTSTTFVKAYGYVKKLPLIPFYSPLAFLKSEEGPFTFVGDAKMKEYFVMTGVIRQGEIQSLSEPSLTKTPPGPLSPHTPNIPLLARYLMNQKPSTALSPLYLR